MIVNPFTYGNPISSPLRFIGRKREVEQIFSRLRNVEFESSSIVGERRIGKTSLFNYVAHPEVRKSHGLDTSKYLFIYEDLERLNVDTTPTQLWQRLLKRLARFCEDADVRRALEDICAVHSIDNFALEDLFDIIDAKDQYVVFLLDEFENVTENPNFDLAYFYGLRSLAIHHHLSLVTSSRSELIELCHSEAIRASPFFNIFANINLRPFVQAEALELISKSLVGTDVSFTDTETNMIFRIAGYHPYFLQVACSFLFDAYTRNLISEERVHFLLDAFREEAAPHLAAYWYNSDDHEKIVLTMLALLDRQKTSDGLSFRMKHLPDLYAHSEQTLMRLGKRGLVVSRDNTYYLFNTSFSEWIWKEITDIRYEQQSYEEWIAANKGAMERLKSFTTGAKKDFSEILPKIKGEYRKLIINWIVQPNALIFIGELIKGALGHGW